MHCYLISLDIKLCLNAICLSRLSFPTSFLSQTKQPSIFFFWSKPWFISKHFFQICFRKWILTRCVLRPPWVGKLLPQCLQSPGFTRGLLVIVFSFTVIQDAAFISLLGCVIFVSLEEGKERRVEYSRNPTMEESPRSGIKISES